MPEEPQNTEPAPPPGQGGERIVYADEDAFNKAMDKAVDRIADKHPLAWLGWVAWCGLLAFLGALLATDWWTSIDLRHGLIPGIDLVKPTGAIIVFWVAGHFIWVRTRHTRVVGRRLCLECGRSLLNEPVDAHGDGQCPSCQRAFNLGEYRAPSENHGEGFQGYLGVEHFDKAMESAGERIRAAEGWAMESHAQGWLWILLGVSFFLSIITGWEFFDILPWDAPYHGVWFVGLLVWGSWYAGRLKKLIPGIIERRRCFACGYSLLESTTDDRGLGRCPECGEAFMLGQYDRPPEDEDDGANDDADDAEDQSSSRPS